jgi:hypothetical protein
MKKTLLAIAAIAVSYSSFSQDLMSKKGEAYLPEAGDYAIGFDAVPLLNVFKFNNNDKANAGYAGLTGDSGSVGILLKKFNTAKSACRFGVKVNWTNTYQKQDVAEQNGGVSDPNNTVENRTRTNSFDINLSLGQEMRRGNTRVQGYYGAEGILALGGTRVNYEYGNDFSDMTDGTYLEQTRSGVRFGLGLRAFLGAEYFIAPKLSLNAEYGLMAIVRTNGRGETDFTTVSGGSDNQETSKGTVRNVNFNILTDVTQGSIRILFHF